MGLHVFLNTNKFSKTLYQFSQVVHAFIMLHRHIHILIRYHSGACVCVRLLSSREVQLCPIHTLSPLRRQKLQLFSFSLMSNQFFVGGPTQPLSASHSYFADTAFLWYHCVPFQAQAEARQRRLPLG